MRVYAYIIIIFANWRQNPHFGVQRYIIIMNNT